MRVAALISGGKDSCFNVMKCVAEGHDIAVLVNLKPVGKDELDSYMYQSVGHHAIGWYAEAMDLPLLRREIQGQSQVTSQDYTPNALDEVEDLYEVLKEAKEEYGIDAVSSGAILSNYQRIRVENVCQRLGLTSLSYLWRRDQRGLLEEMVKCGVEAIIIKVATLGLNPTNHLGKTIAEIQSHMIKMHDLYGLNICGEGGEYETFTLDCPLFKKRLVIDETETVIHSDKAIDPVGYLNIRKAHLVDKNLPLLSHAELVEKMRNLPLTTSRDVEQELLTEDERALGGEGSSPTPCVHPLAQPVHSLAPIKNIRVQHREQGDWWQISGILCWRHGDETTVEATRKAMDSLQKEILDAGHEMKQVVLICLYVSSMGDFASINSVYKTYFGANPPARVCVQAPLPSNVLLQLDCQGVVARREAERTAMHVQSMSDWAPANIGPYSQAVKVCGRCYVAGQIPLVPGSMQVVGGGGRLQARLALRHTQRVLEAMQPGCSLRKVVLAVCYMTHASLIPVARSEWQRAIFQLQEVDTYGKPHIPVATLVEYVVIPALPRNVNIEWQTYASTQSSLKGESIKCAVHGKGTIAVEMCCSSEEADITAARGSIEMPAEEFGDGLSILAQYFRCHMDLLQKMGRTWEDVPLMRIFYRCCLCHYETLYTALETSLQSVCGHVPAFSLVPVVTLLHHDHLLSICH